MEADDYCIQRGPSVDARVAAACAGDDYQLLLALPSDYCPASQDGLIAVGHFVSGEGIHLTLDGLPVALPARLGWEHGPGGSTFGA